MARYKWNIKAVSDQQLIHHSRFWDRTGMIIAGLCIVHCILFPFLILLLPAARAYLQNPILEAVILFAGILVGSISFTTSYRQHRNHYPIMLGLSGVAFLTLSLFVFMESNAHFDFFGVEVDPFLIMGGVFLIIGHAWNLHACHCFCDKSCDSLEHNDHAHNHDHHDHAHEALPGHEHRH